MPAIAFLVTMTNQFYAFDFDGVICDSAVETAISGWKSGLKIWTDMPAEIPEGLIASFRAVRPILETGYESILVLRLLFESVTPATLIENYEHQLEALMIRDEVFKDELKSIFGTTRDEWINTELDDWIAMNPLFWGIPEKLRSIPTEQLVIVTTKQERFVDQIFKANNITLPTDQIYGLDRNKSKPQILTELLAQRPTDDIIFIEDRLPTLLNVEKQAPLNQVKLYLADWGYNTAQDREHAQQSNRMSILTLEQLSKL